jgi:Holliday junction DNA helicase RuvA
MIGWLKGTVKLIDIDAVVLDVGGVGYRAVLSLHDIARSPIGQSLALFVHTPVRDAAIVLGGFTSRDGLDMFGRLVACQGVGPRTALGLLSGIEPHELLRAIADGDQARLTKIPGVGKKTAARIVLELADKLKKDLQHGATGPRQPDHPANDLRSALANLGYKPAQIDRALMRTQPLVDQGEALPVLVKEALKHVN